MKNRTYRFFTGEPLFPFGYGLSYTKFAYRNLRAPAQGKAGDSVTVSAEVENTGALAGEEVVELYVTTSGGGPIRSLQGFRRVSLRPKERKTVEFTLTPRQLSRITADGHAIEEGVLRISIGGKQPGFTGLADAATTGVLTGSIRLTGTFQ